MEISSSFMGCKIISNKPSVDEYEVTNLINGGVKGFICESFVRLPAIVRLEFPLPVDISTIIIDTKFKERKSSGFKILSCIVNNDVNKCSIENLQNCANSDDIKHFYLGNWYSLSERMLLLKNHHYKHCISFPSHKENYNYDDCLVGALRNKNKLALTTVTALTIIIIGVQPFGPPVLKQIKVFGQPSFIASALEKDSYIKLWSKLCIKQKSYNTMLSNPNPDYNTEDVEELESNSEIEVPEEFLDPLTYEIMTLPVLLPSGNTIDSFSLEKFIANEAIWGRSPSDPFTAVPFKDGFKPQPNIHLKARIDRFILLERNAPTIAKGLTVASTFPWPSPKTKASHDVVKSIASSISPLWGTDHSLQSQLSQPGPSMEATRPGTLRASEKLERKVKGAEVFNTYCSAPVATGNVSKRLKVVPSAHHGEQQLMARPTHHSLIKLLGNSANSVSRAVQFRGRGIQSVELSGTAETASHRRSSNPKEDYSLHAISVNAFECSCGSRCGPFYALKCSHKVCFSCVRDESGAADPVPCSLCGSLTERHDLCRTHPKSAFAPLS